MKAKTVTNVESKLSTFNDGKFVRTAIVVTANSSIDLLNTKGERIGQINLFAPEDRDLLMVDVIDVENRFKERRGITFPKAGRPEHIEAGKLVGAHFENPAEEVAGEYTTGDGATVTLDEEGNPV